MKLLIASIILFSYTFSSGLIMRAIKLDELAATADIIALGKIIDQGRSFYTLKVEKNLTGNEQHLTIFKFQNSSNHIRCIDYKLGQKLFVFADTVNGLIVPIGALNEGEIFIDKDSVEISHFCFQPPPPPLNGVKMDDHYVITKDHLIEGKKYLGFKMSISNFIKTVDRMRTCIDFEFDENYRIKKEILNCKRNDFFEGFDSNSILTWVYWKITKP